MTPHYLLCPQCATPTRLASGSVCLTATLRCAIGHYFKAAQGKWASVGKRNPTYKTSN